MEFITENFKIIALALIGIIAGIAITIRISKNNNSNKVNQKNNHVGGDMAGRDNNKK
jgi:hypothetical protein